MEKNITRQLPSSKKQKLPGIEWEYAINVGGHFKEWECKLCHVVKSGGAPRLREHFLGGFGKGGRKCNDPNAHVVAKRLKEEYEKKARNKFGSLRFPTVSQQCNASQHCSASQTPTAMPTAVPTCTPSPEENLGSNVGSASSQHTNGQAMRMRQSSLQESMRATLLEDAQVALAQAIYFSGNAMMMVDNDHWKRAWKKIGEFGAGFTPPSYHSMRNDMLLKCYAHIKERVQGMLLDNLNLSGCTIVSDGWSNVQRKPLINIMIVSP